MASPGPDAPAPAPEAKSPAPEVKSPAPVPASEQAPQSDVNGHVPSEEPTTKPQPDVPAASAAEHPADKEAPSPPLPKSPKPETEKPLVNGNGSTTEHVEPSTAAADAESKSPQPVAETKPAQPEAEAEAVTKSPTPPKPAENPAPAAVDTAPASAADVTAPEPKESEPKTEAPETSEESAAAPAPAPAPAPATSDDVDMADSAPVKDEVAEPTSQPVDKPTTASPVAKEPAPDTEMADSRPDESVVAKPEATDEPAPSQDAGALPSSEVDLGPSRMSQLAIETDEKDTSLDVSMTDAPSAKVAREREEDTTDEPAPKRARTEPKEDEPVEKETAAAPTEATGDVINAAPEAPLLDMTAVTSLTRWTDGDTNAATITPFQRREMRKVIGRVKKTKSGGHFRDSVQKLWPAVWDGYIARIEKPMDLGELDRSLRDPNSAVATWGDFKKNLSLIFENAMDFNGPDHTITAAAAHAVKLVWEDAVSIPAEEPVKPKAVPKPKPVRESRTVATADAVARRQSAGPAGSPDAPAPPAPAQDAPVDRRSSTATDGDRPKRTVRAPKPKDIDYTTKPSRKKLKPELQFCDEVLTELMGPKHHNINKWFTEPVDAEGLGIPSYYSVIKKPMDLGKVQRMLAAGEISSLKEFDKNVRLVFENCYRFNGPPEQGNPVSGLAAQLEDLYVGQMKNKDSWLAKHAKSNAPAASASNASDDEEDEDEGDDHAAQTAAANKDMENLKARLDEETQKLNGFLLSGDHSMIPMQRNIVEMVQGMVIEAAQKVQQSRAAKPEKPAKKSKASKPKAAGGAGRKSTGGGDKPKKAAGTKKAASRKDLSPEEKNQIANAINDLDSPHLDQAIDIIKHDTGQNENKDGELELDIDQLSNAALFKLWDLCKKALPGFGKDSAAAPNSTPEVNRAAAKQGPKTAAKPKKNKPMSAKEQEARIAELNALRQLYKGQEPGDAQKVAQAPMAGASADSSDDSDSEEE
ncbi:transcription regulator BDF1 [Purpureocillium lavendulum]|uniref:Transcription regulator BDF1 n=1 Tax=Purpureocillium lavendulum TaxID=1247861 RepID=A0AB34FPY1_9HYPO|nr:transcription regulator BDF1 [Purpureocillium lavendulum]